MNTATVTERISKIAERVLHQERAMETARIRGERATANVLSELARIVAPVLASILTEVNSSENTRFPWHGVPVTGDGPVLDGNGNEISGHRVYLTVNGWRLVTYSGSCTRGEDYEPWSGESRPISPQEIARNHDWRKIPDALVQALRLQLIGTVRRETIRIEQRAITLEALANLLRGIQ